MIKSFYIFSILAFLTSFGPPLLTMYLPRARPDILSVGEMVDLLTPFISAFTFVMLWKDIQENKRVPDFKYNDRIALTIWLFSLIMVVNGHGIHLSSNSLGHFLAFEEYKAIYTLNSLYDEVISHYFWHIGVFGASFAVLIHQIKYPTVRLGRKAVLLIFPMLLFSFTFAFATIEGVTVTAIAPLCLLGLLYIVLMKWFKHVSLSCRPIVIFFGGSYLLILVMLSVYGNIFGGFPQITELLSNS